MAPRSMTLDVLVRLKDSLSSPLRGLQRSLEGISNMAKKIGIVGTAVAAISFMAPIQEAAAFQQKLVDIPIASPVPAHGGQQTAARTAVDVGGVLRIELASGLRMTGSTPNSPGVSIIASNNGRTVGRA